MAEWYYQIMGDEIGPLSPSEIRGLINEGVVTGDMLVKEGIDGDWQMAATMPTAPAVEVSPPEFAAGSERQKETNELGSCSKCGKPLLAVTSVCIGCGFDGSPDPSTDAKLGTGLHSAESRSATQNRACPVCRKPLLRFQKSCDNCARRPSYEWPLKTCPKCKHRLGSGVVICPACDSDLADHIRGTTNKIRRADVGYLNARLLKAPASIARFAIVPSNHRVVGLARNGWVGVWEFTTGKLISETETVPGEPTALDVSPDGENILFAARLKKKDVFRSSTTFSVYHWQPSLRRAAQLVASIDSQVAYLGVEVTAEKSRVVSLGLQPDSGTYSIATAEGDIRVARLGGQGKVRSFKTSGTPIISPSGRLIAAGLRANRIDLWEVTTGTAIRACISRDDSRPVLSRIHVNSLSFSRDEKSVVSCSGITSNDKSKMQRSAEIAGMVVDGPWGIAAGVADKLLGEPVGENDSPDEKLRATASLRCWNVVDGTLVVDFQNLWEYHRQPITTVALSSDGRHVLSGSVDCIQYWDVISGKHIHRLEDRRPAQLALSPDDNCALYVRLQQSRRESQDTKHGVFVVELPK